MKLAFLGATGTVTQGEPDAPDALCRRIGEALGALVSEAVGVAGLLSGTGAFA